MTLELLKPDFLSFRRAIVNLNHSDNKMKEWEHLAPEENRGHLAPTP